MSKALQTTYTTRLETADKSEIVRVLNDKLAVSSSYGVVDYIAFGVENLTDKLERIKVAKQEIAMVEAETKAQIEYIKQETGAFLSANGVSKLEGDRVSSITVYNPKPSDELTILDEDKLIRMGYTKIILDKTAIKNAIKAGEIDDADAYLTQTLKPTTIKINKKRGA